jgi:hypothetical protein
MVNLPVYHLTFLILLFDFKIPIVWFPVNRQKMVWTGFCEFL